MKIKTAKISSEEYGRISVKFCASKNSRYMVMWLSHRIKLWDDFLFEWCVWWLLVSGTQT